MKPLEYPAKTAGKVKCEGVDGEEDVEAFLPQKSRRLRDSPDARLATVGSAPTGFNRTLLL